VVDSPRASARGFSPVPETWGDESESELREHIRKITHALNLAIRGKLNCTGTVTLTASSTTTTLADIRIGPSSHIGFTPLTASAATAMTSLYVSSRGKETATLTHDSDAATDRDFSYVVLG